MRISKVDVTIKSGAWVGTESDFKTQMQQAIVKAVIESIEEALAEWLPTVAEDSSRMRQSLTNMFLNQMIGIDAQSDFSIIFNRAVLESPHYLKYHDVQWDLNPNYAEGFYIHPTTAGTRPIVEPEIIHHIKQRLEQNMSKEFLALGFNFSNYGAIS